MNTLYIPSLVFNSGWLKKKPNRNRKPSMVMFKKFRTFGRTFELVKIHILRPAAATYFSGRNIREAPLAAALTNDQTNIHYLQISGPGPAPG